MFRIIFLKYAEEIFSSVTVDSKATLKSRLNDYKSKVLKSLSALGLSVDLPIDYELIDATKITDFETFCQADQDINASFVLQRPNQRNTASNFDDSSEETINSDSVNNKEVETENTSQNN